MSKTKPRRRRPVMVPASIFNLFGLTAISGLVDNALSAVRYGGAATCEILVALQDHVELLRSHCPPSAVKLCKLLDALQRLIGHAREVQDAEGYRRLVELRGEFQEAVVG